MFFYFVSEVFEFFKKRITEQYPLEGGVLDPYQQAKEAHEVTTNRRFIHRSFLATNYASLHFVQSVSGIYERVIICLSEG